MRNLDFINQGYYHIYNRGVDKREIFLDKGDYVRFLKYVKEILSKEKAKSELFNCIEFICYCLNPNHFHFIVKQIKENGISRFMHFLGTSYTMYFNMKYQRSGSLFQGTFKSKHIDSDEYLFWLSIYINGNAQIHKYVDNAQNYLWCSYQEYLGSRDESICNKKIILDRISVESYKNTVEQGIPSIIARKLGGYLIE